MWTQEYYVADELLAPDNYANLFFYLQNHVWGLTLLKHHWQDANRITYNRVMKNFVCLTDPSVATVPFDTSSPKSFNAFICPSIINKGRSLALIISRTYWYLKK